MFGPIRGPWPDEAWKGWWGANPPYHVPVFVLTDHAREPITMEGGTTFHFVTDGIQAALRRARAAAEAHATCAWAVAWRRSGSIFRPGSSTKCTSRNRPCCSARASTFSVASIQRSLASAAASMWRARGRCMSF